MDFKKEYLSVCLVIFAAVLHVEKSESLSGKINSFSGKIKIFLNPEDIDYFSYSSRYRDSVTKQV